MARRAAAPLPRLGPFLGAPSEIGALLSSLAAAVWLRQRDLPYWPMPVACAGYAAMIAVFFVFNQPVNAAVSSWTPQTLPTDWPSYRLRWEAGHATAAILALASVAALARGWRQAIRSSAAKPLAEKRSRNDA